MAKMPSSKNSRGSAPLSSRAKDSNDAIQSLELPKASEEGPEENEFIQANYFRVRPIQELVEQKIRIRRYKIVFGKLQLPLRDIEDIRDLIEGIFKQHKPRSTSWTSDYYSYIISADPLYRERSDEAGSAIFIGHQQTIQLNDRKQTTNTTSTLYFEGFFDIDSLENYSRATKSLTSQLTDTRLSGQNRTYVPLEDFRILSLISWETIYSSSFKGDRVGKKFHPYCKPQWILNRSNARFKLHQHYVYDVHMEFFTSMRPGLGFILLNGLQVTFDLDKFPKKKYVISGVHDLCVEKVKSEVSSSNDFSESVWKYMQSCYPGSVHTFNKAASCVNVGNSSHPKLLPADHLRICEWQTVHGKSDNLFTAQMLGFAKKTPFQNEQEIMNKALIPLDIKPQKNGLTLEKELLNVPSSWLDHPFFTFKPGKTKKLVSASWNPSDVKDFNKAERYHELIIIHVTRADMISDNQTEIVSKFAKALASQLKGHGLQTQPFKWDGPTVAWQKVNKDKKPFNSTAERQEVVNGLLTTYLMRGDKSRMVFLILADKDAAVYSDIKRWGDCNLGIATVCVCPSAVVKKSSDILDNLSLKANFKLGGTNHIIGDVKEPSEHIESVQNDSLMIFGADFVSDLGGMIKERLQLYQGNNEGNLALNILFYRHGISESQFGMALTQELPQIYKACKEFAEKQGKSNIRITLLVVTKRHHTRLFPLKLTNSTENISGGLVVDKHIVNPNQMIFFLQSHDSALGTARPAHYTVTANQCELTLKQLERVTHKLSFVGFRATKGLSVCVPAQYADILCDRLRFYMKPELDGEIRRTKAQIQKSKDPLAHYHGHSRHELPWIKSN